MLAKTDILATKNWQFWYKLATATTCQKYNFQYFKLQYCELFADNFQYYKSQNRFLYLYIDHFENLKWQIVREHWALFNLKWHIVRVYLPLFDPKPPNVSIHRPNINRKPLKKSADFEVFILQTSNCSRTKVDLYFYKH